MQRVGNNVISYMASLTQSQIRAISNFSAVAYYGGNLLPALTAGDHTIRHIDANNPFGTSLTGDNGAVITVIDGMHGEVELTFRGMGKFDIVNILKNRAVNKTTSTSSANPFGGGVSFTSRPEVAERDALVIYPLFTDRTKDGGTGVRYEPNSSNPMAIVFPHASYVDSFEFSMNSGSVTDVTCLFRCHNDPTQDPATYAYQGLGIASDGTIS